MNKKGFTLVEILVAIVLIGLLFGIGVAGIRKITEGTKEKSFLAKKDLALDAANLYGQNNKNRLNNGICEIEGNLYQCKLVSIEELIEENYLDNENKLDDQIEFTNPLNEENIKDACVAIYVKNNRVYTHIPNINDEVEIENSCKYKETIQDDTEYELLKYKVLKNNIEDLKIPLDYEQMDNLYKFQDDLGISYVYRGDVKDNYINFANKLWKILRINGDGSFRLIYAEHSAICGDDGNGYVYNPVTTVREYINYSNGIVDTELKEWYKENLIDYDNKISNTNYCNDREEDIIFDLSNNIISNKTGYYNVVFNSAYRAITKRVRLTCGSSDTLVQKIGIPSLDELLIAGADIYMPNEVTSNSDFMKKRENCSNGANEEYCDTVVMKNYITKYNLKNKTANYNNRANDFWTMTPYDDSTNWSNCDADNWFYDSETNLVENTDYNIGVNGKACIRPLISLKNNIRVKSGDGTKTNPYIIN